MPPLFPPLRVEGGASVIPTRHHLYAHPPRKRGLGLHWWAMGRGGADVLAGDSR